MNKHPSALRQRMRLRRALTVGAVAATLVVLSACSSQASTGSGDTNADKYGTKSHPITITFWGWGGPNDNDAAIAEYKKLHPYVTVKSVQFTSTQPLYTKLATVFKAGTGAPDASSMELSMLPTFAAEGGLVPITPYGGSVSDMNPASAKSSYFEGQLYTIPSDSAPAVMYYRADLFKKYNIPVPTTWDQYLSDAKTLKKDDPTAYMTFADPGDSTATLGLIWQAGGQPFQLKGTKDLSINLGDAGSVKYANLWSTMLKDQLVKPDPAFTSTWFTELGNGTYATWLTGAWGASTLATNIPQTAGDWRVAPLPEWTAGSPASALMGGSGGAVTKASTHKAAAAAWLQFFGEDWPKISGHGGASSFPATLKVENDPSFVATPSKILGNQLDVPVYKKASKSVVPGWQFVPYNLYANSIFKDTVGQEFASGFNVEAGLKAWQAQLATYGKSQGFSVKTGG